MFFMAKKTNSYFKLIYHIILVSEMMILMEIYHGSRT